MVSRLKPSVYRKLMARESLCVDLLYGPGEADDVMHANRVTPLHVYIVVVPPGHPGGVFIGDENVLNDRIESLALQHPDV